MTQEDKDLLLRDLSARLPYGVKCKIDNFETIFDIRGIDNDESSPLRQRVIVWKKHYPSSVISYDLQSCKPYLRPMSSMTEEEINEYENFIINEKNDQLRFCNELVFYNSHHLDYRGLIEKGLAIEAPKGMYKNE